MTSGVYGRRVIDSHIRNDDSLFSQDQYPITGANRALPSELDSAWDKGNDSKAVKNSIKNSVSQSHNMTGCQSLAPNRSVGLKVAFHEPTVSYREEFDPLHGSVTGGPSNLASTTLTVEGGNKAPFSARDFRTNDFDLSRVTVRTKPPNQIASGLQSALFQTNAEQPDYLQNECYADRHLPLRDENSLLVGTVVPARVLNDGATFLKRQEKSNPSRRTKDLKSAGIATTRTHFDPDQVYKHLRKEGIKKPASDKPTFQSALLSGGVGPRSPLFQASPYAACKRVDIVRQRKKMKQNSEALERLKERIQRQKERSPSMATSPAQKPAHHEEDPAATVQPDFQSEIEKPRMRKIAHGPAAPKYKGFSTAETRIRTPDGKVWKQGETAQPLIPPRTYEPEKRPKAASSLFKTSELKSKPPLTSGRLRPDSSAKINKSKNQKPIRKTGKIKVENSIHKRSIITPASWREGQRIAESILGPPPKQSKKVTDHDDQRPDSPPTRDTEPIAVQSQAKKTRPISRPSDVGNANSYVATAATTLAASKATSNRPTEGRSEKTASATVNAIDNAEESIPDGGKSHQKKMSTSIKASIPTDKLSIEARGVLDDLQLSSSDSDSDEEDRDQPRSGSASRERKQRHARGRTGRPQKHPLSADPKDSKTEKASKVRHYVQSEVQQYIAKQKADRKRKQSQERKAHKKAQERKQKQLEELYRKQKEAASAKKKMGDWEGRPRPLKHVDLTAAQALRRMDGILEGTGDLKTVDADESDKENMQMRRQPLAKFDERMSAFMDKLNQLESHTPPSTYSSQVKVPEKRSNAASAPTSKPADTTSKFMQKLDRYLNNESPVTAVSGATEPTPVTEIRTCSVAPPDECEPNLTVEDLGSVNEAGSYRPQTVPTYGHRYGDPSGTFSPRYRQMMDQIAPSEEFTSKQRSRAERIAALRAKAESLQERIETESRKLVEQPIMSTQPLRLQEIDAILAKSSCGRSLPIHAWSTDAEKKDFRGSGSQWRLRSTDRGNYGGIDVPDMSYPRGGLDDLSPSQLPGVTGLRRHVDETEKHKSETDAALKIQSTFRGYSVRQALDEWKLPSGKSVTDLRRQAASSGNVTESGVHRGDEDSISERPLSSRSDCHSVDTPIKLRSVEEILADMKTREYCVTDPPPIDDMLSNRWADRADDDLAPQHASDFLSDLDSRTTKHATLRDYPLPQADADKPPWERTGGDKYSVINVIANKYLKSQKGKQKHRDEDVRKSNSDTSLSARSQKLNNATPKSSRSEQFTSPLSKKSPRAKSFEKYSPRFEDDTARDATETLSCSVDEDISKSRSYTSPRSREPIYQKDPERSDTVPKDLQEKPSEVLVGRVSYSSDEDEKASMASLSVKEDHFSGAQHGLDGGVQPNEKYEADLSMEASDASIIAPLPRRLRPAANSAPFPSFDWKFSPAALEQKMSAELNYQESIEESLRHLTGVERTQGVSLAQQETVSLAQLMKARQLQHEMETDRLTLKAKQEAFDAERIKAASRAEEEEKRSRENLKMQEASRKALEIQAEAAQSTAEAAKHLAHVLRREPRSYHGAYSPASERGSENASFSTSESERPREPASGSSSDAERKGKKSAKLPSDRAKRQGSSPPSLMSEHSTTSVRLSNDDTQSSVPEQMASTEEEDGGEKGRYKKLSLGKMNEPNRSTANSVTEDLPMATVVHDASDKTISEDIAQQSDSSVPLRREKGGAPTKKKLKDAKGGLSDSSEASSIRFDESLTEDEIAEISRRAVVASEVHRRHQRRRSPHSGPFDRSDVSSDDQPSLARQKTPRGGTLSRGLDDFSIGPGITGAADSEFVHFMDDMVRQYMLEEEVRAKHQDAMLKLRQRTIKEKTEAELAMLERMKKQVKNKGDDEKMPPIKKKERAILRRFKMETDEIKKLKAVTKAASQERKLFLQQHKESAARRAKLRAAEEKLELDGDIPKPRSKDDLKEPHLTSSTPIPSNANISDLPDLDASESNSELDISSASSLMLKKLKTRSFDERRLTKREQRLVHRKKQAEQLIAWKKRLDQEEKTVCDIEKQALSAWEKEGDVKIEKSKLPSSGETQTKDTKETDRKSSPKSDSSREESSSGKSPVSEHHSSPPPASHSESSIAEEIIQINSGTNSSRSVVSPEQNEGAQRNQEESSDGTNADDYSQSFDSVTASQRTPRSPKSRDREAKVETLKETESPTEAASVMHVKKDKKDGDKKSGDVDSPSATPLLPSKKDDPSSRPTTSKVGPGAKEATSPSRRESVESWSDESFSQTQSEAEQSDIECRVRALKEELKRRRIIAERLKKEQKRRHKDRLKAQEASLRSQIEAYDVFIRKTQNELHQELGNQSNSAGATGPVAKPQIRSPRKTVQARQSARAVRSAAAAASPEASPRSGSQKTPAIFTKQRTESESSGKSSRSLSFDDEERVDDVTPNGSAKSYTGVVAPLPSKHHDGLSSGGSTPTEKRSEKPKHVDLTDAAMTLSKLTKPLSPNGFAATEKPKSLIPVASTQPQSLSKVSPTISAKSPPSSVALSSLKTPTPTQPLRKSLIPLPVSTSSQSSVQVVASSVLKEKPVVSPPSPQASEKSLAYSEDFEFSAASKKTQEDGSVTGSVTTDEDISEHFSDVSGTSGERSDKSGAMLDLFAPPEKRKDSPEPNKDDSLHGVAELAEQKGKVVEGEKDDDDDGEATPVISPAQSPIPSSPRTPTPDLREPGPTPFQVGDRVILAGRESGTVRFVGETSFAPGIWVGAELKKANGKNDGSVNGKRYFTCPEKHGIFAPLARVSLLSPKSGSTSSTRSAASLRFEYGEELTKPADDERSTEGELSKASEASKKFEELAKAITSTELDETSPRKASPTKTGLDRNRLADELSDRLLSSLLEDSVTNVLDSHADKRQRQEQEEDLEAKRRKKEDEEDERMQQSSDEEIPLSASTKNLLEMLASSPDKEDEQAVDVEAETEAKQHAHESLADNFTGDLLQDTLTKVLEIRKQRAKKWRKMEEENEKVKNGEDLILDDGREVEDILEAKRRKQGSDDEEPAEDKESTTPVRPVSPIFGASQDDGLDDWFEDDIGISSFHKNKPTINKDDTERSNDDEEFWQDGRLVEVMSSRIEPPPPPPKFVVPHRPEHILRLVEDAVDYYYSKYLRGELTSDVRIPDFLFNDKPDELSERGDKDSDESDQEKKEADTNANHIFKTSLFDMVRELIMEIYSAKSNSEDDDTVKRPMWLKKKSAIRPSYCRRVPKTGEELVEIVCQQVGKILDLSGDAHKLDPRITMKWGNRKKKDKVDLILIQELREEEPEWTNYDEDETTVKMQLTDIVLDLLLSDTAKCLDGIERKREERESVAVPAGEDLDDPAGGERSQ